jgi:hypothetical protein
VRRELRVGVRVADGITADREVRVLGADPVFGFCHGERGDAAVLVRGTDVTTSPAAVQLNRERPPDRATTYNGAPDAKGGST